MLMLGVLSIAGTVVGQPLEDLVNTTAAVGDVVVPAPEGDAAGTVEKLLTTWLPRLVMACGALAAFIPSTGKFMRIVDVFAFNWNKARSDPNAQKWGKA